MVLPEKIIPTHFLFLLILIRSGFKLFKKEKSDPQKRFYPEFNAVKGHIMLMVTIAIFACDFSSFPAKHLKTKYHGISLMDVGIGSFLYHNGIIAPKLSKRRLLKIALYNIVLGMVRTMTIRYFDYTVDITEYGRDLNFYFMLSITYLLFSVIHICTAWFLVHQTLLSNGLEEYIFKEERKRFIELNKEGIFNIAPSLSIFLF
jgi:phosphatidylinositol glycan class W